MANTLTETVIGVRQRGAARHRRDWKRWPKRLLLLAVLVWVVDLASPVVIGHTPLRRWLTQRLEAGFGRAVEVGSYSLSLWGGPAIEAHEVTVAEDARFGQEYFLRAESLTVRLRLRSLFGGRLEPGTLSLSRPSLNLVRNAAGDWNLAEWLPRPGNAPGTAAGATGSAARFWRIEVEAGRINFKKSDEKLLYAFTNVSGKVESEGAGRWGIDLRAVPSRAAVIVQQPGMLHLSGDLGGTSSRLRPAKLALSWDGASISDVLRIGRGYDYGIRGNLALTATAHTDGGAWMIEGRVDVAQAHRWDLAARVDNPSASVHAKMKLDFENSALILEEAKLDTANSQASGYGNWSWSIPPYSKRPIAPMALTVTQASVDLSEVLSWTRAFRTGVAEDVTLRGSAAMRGHAEGWPLQLVDFVVSSSGATLSGSRLRAPVKLGAIQGRYDHSGISLFPAAITLGPPGGSSSLHAEITSKPGPNPGPVLHVSGNVTQSRDLIATAGALGWSLSRGWDVAGPMRCDLKWQSTDRLWHAAPSGFLELGEAGAGGGASLRAPFINQPLEQIRARAEIRPGVRHVTVTSAEAFGSRWAGTLDRPDGEGWQFAISADHLASTDLDRWLNPRWRQSFFERVLPFLNSSGPASAAPENLRASGRLSVGQFAMAPLVIRGLTGDLKIDGRRVELTDATGEVFGGQTEGDFDVTLAAVPEYRVRANFSGLNVAALAGASQTLGNLLGGSASGEILVEARGGSRAELANSLTCEGSARVKDAEVRGFDLIASLRDGARRPGKSAFRLASGTFTCGQGRIQFDGVRFTSATIEVSGSGSVDFGRNLDLRLRVTPEVATPRATRASYGSGAMYQVTGPLVAPKVTATEGPAAPARP